MNYTRFNRDKLRSGMILHERGTAWLSWAIRVVQNRWEYRICDRLGVPMQECWGNHDGLFIGPDVPHIGSAWGIGEALADGNVITPLESYEADMAAGKCQVRVFEPLPRTEGENIPALCWRAATEWSIDEESHGYDFWAYPGLILRAFLNLNWNTESKHRFYCTEAVAACFKDVGYDLLQDSMPAPFEVEQVSGIIPRPAGRTLTLREVTGEVMLA